MKWIGLYLAVGLAAVLASTLATWLARRLAWKLDFLDVPLRQQHKQHQTPTPLLGGAAMVVAWTVVTLGGAVAAMFLGPRLPPALQEYTQGIRTMLPLLGVIAGGGVALGVMGLVDDKRPLHWPVKLGLQMLLCAVVIAVGPKLRITLFFLPPALSWAVTLAWLLFIINAFNFFDNMDGLAAGVAFIASLIFAFVAGFRGQVFVALLGAATAGVTLGYYFFNRHPASIFMGDSGSHFLGYLLAVQGCLTSFYQDQAPTVAPVFIPVMVLALPIFDTFAVMVIRVRQGRSIFYGDHNHISHRFLRLGVSRPTAVLLVHMLMLALGLGALTLLFVPTYGVLIIFMQTAAVLAFVTILHSATPDPNGDGNGNEGDKK